MSVVLNSKIRVNRNIKDFNFPSKLNEDEAKIIIDKVKEATSDLGYENINIKDTPALKKLELFEDEIITGELLKNVDKSIVLLKESSPEILVNELDHIVIQRSRSELNLKDSFDEVMKLDNDLDKKIDFSYNSDFGYLTSNPMNCGTGLVPSVTMHLPATVYYGILNEIKRLKSLGYNIEGIHGENTKSMGNIYIITPDRAIGLKDEDYIEKLNEISIEIMTSELEKRKKLYLENILDLEDMVYRSFGILKNARIIDEEEMMHHFSNIFLGIELNILKPSVELDLVDTVKKFKNGHIQIERGSLLDKRSRDILRANNIRRMIKEVF